MATVSLSALKSLVYGPRQETVRYHNIKYGNLDKYKSAIRLDPTYSPKSPYDIWGTTHGRGHGVFNSEHDIREYYEPIQLEEWDAYITSAFLQTRPDRFLDYMRLIESAGPNPFVTWSGTYTPASDIRGKAKGTGKYVDTVTGETSSGVLGPHPAMYPHTYKGDTPDYSITTDRFRETLIQYALGETYTILDIAKTTDPQFLQWAYKRVSAFLPEIKSWIDDASVVSLIQNGKIRQKKSRRLPREIQTLFRKAADDALVIIQLNMDKLAERDIELRALKVKGVEPSFLGPEWLNPLASANITEAEIARELSKRSVIRPALNYTFSVPSIDTPKISTGDIPPTPKRGNALVPIAAGAAAVGLVAALT